jgi:hypothetical protein
MLNLVRFGIIAASGALTAETFNRTSYTCKEVEEKCDSVWNLCLSRGNCCGKIEFKKQFFDNTKKITQCDCKVYEALSNMYFINIPKDENPLFSVEGQEERDASFTELVRNRLGYETRNNQKDKRVSCGSSEDASISEHMKEKLGALANRIDL